VHEVENTEVTRKTAKGQIITETVQGSLDRVPRIISTRKLDPTYIVVNSIHFHLTNDIGARDVHAGNWPTSYRSA
jgi:hypothetical protein